MKVAICIPTFNRPEYLIQTLDSLLESINGFETIIITDDGSTDKKVFSIIDRKLFGYKNKIIIKHDNFGIAQSLKLAIDCCKDYDVIITLDSDFIIKQDFIKKLCIAVLENPENIITGFNANSHPFEYKAEYLIKKTIGGGNLAFTWKTYLKHIRPCLIDNMWDWRMCDSVNKENERFLCFSPSICQHIGEKSTLGHIGADKAEDYA